MLPLIFWYVDLAILGLLTFPFVFRLFYALPDRGYAFSRILGLLLWSYVFWLLGSLGLLSNDIGGILFALIIVIVISFGTFFVLHSSGSFINNWRAFKHWIITNKKYIVGIEILFFVSFMGMAIIRAANPEILGTEKPMELAFINAILRSPTFPPHDPWLSGYAISYYYFGYVIIAMLAKLTGTLGSVAFNLGVSLVFSLSAIGVFGIVYNLLPQKQRLAAIIAPIFMLILGNWGGVLELLHSKGIFWDLDGNGNLTSSFWKWLDIKNLDQPPMQPLTWFPQRYYWWWQSSRVVQDYNLNRQPLEIIDEFPSFSYILGDLHPHVLAMPFVLLVIAFILNLYLGGCQGEIKIFNKIKYHLSASSFILGAWLLGSLAFLNTWDFPMYLVLLLGGYFLYRARGVRVNWNLLGEMMQLGFTLSIIGVILYLPFYIGFSSQAGGFIPNLIFATRGVHFWVMFGVLLLPLIAFLVSLGKDIRKENQFDIWLPIWISIGLVFILWLLSLIMGYLITQISNLREVFLGLLGAQDVTAFFQEAFLRRLINIGGWGTMALLLAAALGLFMILLHRIFSPKQEDANTSYPEDQSHQFVLLLVIVGILLVIFPEFFYIKDQFGWRINTIFKFYYQTWVLWSIAAAYATVEIFTKKSLFSFLIIITILMGFIYPVLGVWTKTNGFHPPDGWTLDGGAYLEKQKPDEMIAISWLRNAPYGIIMEAVGGSYSEYARVSTYSGLPTILGWPGHESQWRGGATEMGNRETDIEKVYRTKRWDEMQTILKQYDVRYVFLGSLERSKYNATDLIFKRYLKTVFHQADIAIFEVP